MNNVPVVLAGIYASRSEVDAARPHSACARQTIRRLVSFGFTLDVLNKLFRIDPKYEVPAIIFLQDMSEVHKLLVHHQSIVIGGLIKQYFVRTTNI
jgi:predicted subunit of tRNA(5-methylaminomethyl-2-thiouridylate) methyltransferase